MQINHEDYERDHLKDRIFVGEEEYLFWEEMKHSNPNIEERQPAKVINLSKNDTPNPISLSGNNKERIHPGHDLSANTDK